jgi:branched-chain amino acid transport system permease protein
VNFFLQLVVTGIALGMIYALIAIGFVMITKSSNVFNIAQGHFVMLGGYLGYTFLVITGFPLWLSILCMVGVAALMGLIIERLLLRPLIGQPVISIIMMTIALATIIEGMATLIWGGQYKTYHDLLPTFSLKIGFISIPSEPTIGFFVSAICVGILMIFYRYTKLGLGMRATAEDLNVAQSFGIRATTIYKLAWVVAFIVGVIGGLLLGAISGVMVPLAEIGLKAFTVALFGGVESLGGAVIAGIILGVLENLASGYLDPLLPRGGFAGVFPFVVMIIVLIIRPYGFFGLKKIERV